MNQDNETISPKADAGEKLAYHKPELKEYGTLRTVTLANTSDGEAESVRGIGYSDTVYIDPNNEAGWSRHDRGSGAGRGRRDI